MSPLPFTPTDFATFVPHRGAMCLVHRLIDVDDRSATAEVDVPSTGLFARPDGVPAWVGLEYMAQTVAAWSGARARQQGARPRNGYLLGTRRYQSHVDHFVPGQTLRIHIQCELIAGNGLGQFSCQITDLSGLPLAQAMVSVYEPATDST